MKFLVSLVCCIGLLSSWAFAGAPSTTVEDIISNNVGSKVGRQKKDNRHCSLVVEEFEDDEIQISVTYHNPTRLRSIYYPEGAIRFALDPTKGKMIFDKSDMGKPDLVFNFNLENLTITSVEEENQEVCEFDH